MPKNKKVSNRLTPEQWRDQKPPFHWMRVKEDKWPAFNFEIAEKSLYTAASGWWYHGIESNGVHLFVFELNTDMVRFKLWIASDPFTEEYGEIE